ncbi:hypothetical protein [Ammonifex thiophilus]|uniref:PI3K/PI4K catalytic domain-containing protein n=1 Tax=Ammonifex thiophilus TaxID=444093 RepID=A0A3D8P3H9_9THEO|nr:hypothetical protein [Ammonifex thiophilus]RDV81796.1 hypothetical protein DXX99_08835 [Ammonifex thiophilus]
MGGGKKKGKKAAALAFVGGGTGGAGVPPGAAKPQAPGDLSPTAAGYEGLDKAVSAAPKGSSPVLAAFAAGIMAKWPKAAQVAAAVAKKKVKHGAVLAGSPVLGAVANPAYPDAAETTVQETAPAAEADAAALPAEERERLSQAEAGAVAAFMQASPDGTVTVAFPALDVLSLIQKAKEKVAKGSANLKLGASDFSQKVRRIIDVFKFRRAVKESLPDVGAEEVAQLKLSYAGPASHLGGVHEKHFYTDEKGRRWLFKPDKNTGGVKAAVESVAANIARRVGVGTLPVFTVETDQGVGSLQPFVENAQPLGPDPAKYSPAQVRELVRQHVVSWAIGDFDAKHDNFITTPSGAMVNVDKGQAFKYFGEDRLDLNYHPNRKYGAPPPVYYALYRAAREGKVQLNPYDALPVIEVFERIPDDEYRELLRPLVEAAVKSPRKEEVAWWQRMAKFAAERLGRQPSPEEVGEEFLRRAVERKNGLRRDFAGFFGEVLGQVPAF